MRLTGSRKVAAMISFVVLGLSPSFEDWQQSPEKRKQFLLFYGVAGTLFYYGLLS